MTNPNTTLADELEADRGANRELDARVAVALYDDSGHADARDNTTARLPSASDGCAAGTYWISSFSGLSLRTAPDYTSDRTLKRLALAALRTPAPAPVGGDVVGLLNAILDAQNAQPYRGWNITKLNKAVDAAREHLGLPSIRELNPDIAAMQDHARANKDAIQSALQSLPAPAQGDDVVELDWATAFEKAAAKTARLEQELNIANADHIALWLEANTIPDEPMSQCISWLACRIVEAHERALAAMPPKVEAPAEDEVRELVHKLRGVAAYSAVDVPVLKQAADMLECLSHPTADAVAVERWRPIETAPKDGSRFLVWEKHYGIRIGRCKERADHDDWLSYMDAFNGSSKGGPRATHWMPLPTPPAAIRAGGHP